MGSSAPVVSPAAHLRRIVSVLEQAPAVSYILDSDLRFVYCNPAWDKFAVENGGPQLAGGRVIGAELFSCVPPVLRVFYSGIFAQVRRSALVWRHVYECSSPERYRTFRMLIHVLASHWLLVTNSLVVERAHSHPVEADPGHPEIYANEHGLISMCAHCRCSQRRDKPEQWDFVPAHFKLRPSTISHALCPVCRVYFYPAQ